MRHGTGGREPYLRFYTADGEPLLHQDAEVAQERTARVAVEQRRGSAASAPRGERQREEAQHQRVDAECQRANEPVARIAAERQRDDLEQKLAEIEARLAGLSGEDPQTTGDNSPT